MARIEEPTTEQLRAAFRETGLTFLGFSFEWAMAVRPIRVALACKVKAARRAAGKDGWPAPFQPGLI